jgi:AbiV family abortive infection protein
MKDLTLNDIYGVRVAVFGNALSLQKEAELLFQHEYFARAYLLAHFVTEELGKLVILANPAVALRKGESVDWRYITNRFPDHSEKVGAGDALYAIGGLDPGVTTSDRIEWLKAAAHSVRERVRRKNRATYVDVADNRIQSPLKNISRDMAAEMLQRSAKSLDIHFETEVVVNPFMREGFMNVRAEEAADSNGEMPPSSPAGGTPPADESG